MPGNPLRDTVLNHMRANPSQPMTKSSLARHLKISATERSALRRTIDELMAEGLIFESKTACYLLKNKAKQTLSGTLKFHPKGHAYFFPDASDPSHLTSGIDITVNSRIFISRRDTGNALDGDRVLISIQKPTAKRPFRTRSEITPDASDEPSGKVEDIIQRRSGRLVGTFRSEKAFSWVDCDDKAIDGRIEISGDTTAQPGQLVVVDIENWTSPTSQPKGRIIEVLGWPGDPSVDIISVIHRYGLRTSFPDAVLSAARSAPESPEPEEIARREDWRKALVITIDPADAKDHDDAIWVTKKTSGWQLAVHIADVSHYIKPGSDMDQEAIQRGNSTYLVDRVLPMLPVELSNGICSLKPHVDRLTKCALLDISPQGEVTRASFFDAVIHSRAKLSYEQAQAILDGAAAPDGSEPELCPMIQEAWNLASIMRRRRFHLGALDLEMPEIKIRLDSNGHACAADPVIHTSSHQLVEEFMLAANDAVARILRERMKPAIYRVHDDPDPSRLIDYTETAKAHGYHPGDLTNRSHIQQLLDLSKGTPEEHIIKLGLLKSLKRAAYAAEPTGHYGLAKADYCHFTSPIRRYADLIVHRALQPLLSNPPTRADTTPSQAELLEIARHISDTERNSAEAESETKQIKLFEYLQHIVDTQDDHSFEGLVSEARTMGLMVEIPNMGVRGVVKREDLPSGRWRLESHRAAWVSSDGHIIQMGMKVALRVIGLDRVKRFVDFTIVSPPSSEPALSAPRFSKDKPKGKKQPKPSTPPRPSGKFKPKRKK